VKKLCTSTFGFVSASLDVVVVVVVVVIVVVRSTAHTVSSLFIVAVSSSSSSSSLLVAAASASSVVLARFRARVPVPASVVLPPPSSPSAFARGKNDAIDLVDAIVVAVAPFARAETRRDGETDE
jgi:hypothetical protein